MIDNKTPHIMLSLYKSLVRPHVEYCVSAWSTLHYKDFRKAWLHWGPTLKLLETIHWNAFSTCRFTRLIPGMQKLSYMERLAKLNLWSLEERRNRSDLIEVFRMANNLSPIPLTKFFKFNTDNRTRGHSFKLVKHRCNCEVRRHFFSERVVNRWNMLDQD